MQAVFIASPRCRCRSKQINGGFFSNLNHNLLRFFSDSILVTHNLCFINQVENLKLFLQHPLVAIFVQQCIFTLYCFILILLVTNNCIFILYLFIFLFYKLKGVFDYTYSSLFAI